MLAPKNMSEVLKWRPAQHVKGATPVNNHAARYENDSLDRATRGKYSLHVAAGAIRKASVGAPYC
jgi:hypothetical protein